MSQPTPGFVQRASISLLWALTGVAIPFIHLALLNTSNLTLPLSVHAVWLCALCMVIAGLVFAVQSLVPARIRTAVCTMFLLLGIVVWAESTLLIGNFGFLQGHVMDWGKARSLLYLELLLAGVLAAILWRARSGLLKHAASISGLLILSALGNLVPAYQASRGIRPDQASHTFTQRGLLELSPDRNVLLFIVDTYQSDVFAEIISSHPEWKDRLAGFTYFPDATSAFPKTYASVPDILTGKAFDNTEPFAEYLRNAYYGGSVPLVLKEHGFDARYRSFVPHAYYPDPAVADNLSEINSPQERLWMQRREFIQLVNLTIFRISPYLAKPWAYNNNRFRIREKAIPLKGKADPYPLTEDLRVHSKGNRIHDLAFHDRFMAYVSVGSERPAFRVYHFSGAHAPFLIDRKLNVVEPRPLSRAAMLEQAEGILKMLVLEFERLREIGAWDNSLVFVLGDHGAGEYAAVGINADVAGDLGLASGGAGADSRLIQGGIPLVLVKGLQSTGEFRVSRAPVQLSDIPNTVFEALGYGSATSGPSIFQIPEGSERSRLHRAYRFSGWGQDYIVPLTEYEVSGFSWDSASWSATGRDLNHNAIAAAGGTFVVLGEGGNLGEFEHWGWSPADSQGRRIANGRAFVSLPLPQSRAVEGVGLEFRINPGSMDAGPVDMILKVNGEAIGRFVIHNKSRNLYRATIPDRLCVAKTSLEVGFELEDHDNIGPLIIEIRQREALASRIYVPGTTLSFATAGSAGDYTGQGWWAPEDWGRWTRGYEATMSLALGVSAGQSLEMETRFRPAIFDDADPVEVSVIANGELVASWNLGERGDQSRVVTIPGRLIAEGGHLDLVFAIRNPRSPKKHGGSIDPRKLGLGFKEIVFR